jgi:hypothetical protein
MSAVRFHIVQRQRLAYPQLEGRLYGLGGRTDGPVARSVPSFAPTHATPAPRGIWRESVPKVDLALAVERHLTPDERKVISDHYVHGVQRHGYRTRSRIMLLLMEAELDAAEA